MMIIFNSLIFFLRKMTMFRQILMHGSSVSAFASRIMELQAKDFFSRYDIGMFFFCFLLFLRSSVKHYLFRESARPH
jgi:hypothetical protein